MTVKHILIECADTALTREQYFNCNDLKALFNSVAGDIILAYLSEINLLSTQRDIFLGFEHQSCW